VEKDEKPQVLMLGRNATETLFLITILVFDGSPTVRNAEPPASALGKEGGDAVQYAMQVFFGR
jgi:hypothetical protein